MTSRRVVAPRGALLLAASMALVLGACDGQREVFLGARVHDACDGTWPVCEQKVGCLLGPESYAEGRWPGRAAVLVQTHEPARVQLSFFLTDVRAAGEETALVFHEAGCRGRTRVTASGRTVVDESSRLGTFTREVELLTAGDHLLEFESDAQAWYLVKVDVLPLESESQN